MAQNFKNTYPRFYRSLLEPVTFVILMWMVFLMDALQGQDFLIPGIIPREPLGLIGIITFPLVHGDLNHLFSNTVPLLVLGMSVRYFYQEVAYKVFLIIYFLHGALIWLFARDVMHVGASGIVYGLATFLFLSGILRKDRQLMALSLLIAFLYGGLIWGVLPIREGVSWEGHLFGALSGFLTALIYRNQGPQRKGYDWEDEAEDDENNDRNQPKIWDPRSVFPPPNYPGDEE